MTKTAINRLTAKLATLKFFPTRADAVEAVTEAVIEFASTDEQLDWLGRRVVALFTEWPGPRELRAIFCARFKPADGFEVPSAAFPEGVPSELSVPYGNLGISADSPNSPKLSAPPLAALPSGHEATTDEEFERAIRDL